MINHKQESYENTQQIDEILIESMVTEEDYLHTYEFNGITHLRVGPSRRGLARSGNSAGPTGKYLVPAYFVYAVLKLHSTLAFEEIYRHAYKIVLMMRAPDLYEQVKQLEQDWLKTNVRTLIVDSISSSLDAWEDHQLGMGMVTDVLMYMDRMVASRTHPPIDVAYMALFQDHILRAPVRAGSSLTAIDVLESTILFIIQLERSGHIIERPLIRHCI
ncbi:hypothetical protein N7471_000922 [Penicillium samsonianum]|uniref:uncharacterized protein n=1 Tax=Penicillium samsonianum TaxID=1882272 RepID=UPI0025472F54|nr:uncharacterized protein N7471_000922 [Penicillium samsonianum]KAJ6149723.1 hypothetical protein N7471_000922 [Penicillium samsonianum]